MTITTAQIRGARGILNWSQADLAERTGISATSIGSIENGVSTPRANTVSTIQRAFESAGIEFIDGGVRLQRSDIRIFEGRDGFADFYKDIYETLRQKPGEVLVSNVDERDFEKWLGLDNVRIHVDHMKKISGVTYKIAIREGDTYYLASADYAQYRWLPRDMFSAVPFYVYADKLAILLFKHEPTVIVLNYAAVADAYRLQFKAMWDKARIPDGGNGR